MEEVLSSRLALVASSNSIWTKRYIERIALKHWDEVILISTEDTEYEDIKNNKRIKCINVWDNNPLLSIPKLRGYIVCKRTISIINTCGADSINIFYCSPKLVRLLGNSTLHGKLILNYIGSDILRISADELYKEKKIVSKADAIVMDDDNMRIDAQSKADFMNTNKLFVIHLGCEGFDFIDNYIDNKMKYKKDTLGPDVSEKKIIAIGYNSCEQQQHIRVLDEINKLPRDVLDQLFIVFPMTYGTGGEEYKKRVRDAVAVTGIQYAFFEEFMSVDEICKLWNCIDIYINTQTTDGMAGSVLELLYSGVVMISGEWLNYSSLDRLGVDYIKLKEFGLLCNSVNDAISKLDDYEKTAQFNRSLLRSEFSWDTCERKWDEVYSFAKI